VNVQPHEKECKEYLISFPWIRSSVLQFFGFWAMMFTVVRTLGARLAATGLSADKGRQCCAGYGSLWLDALFDCG
jgi:hypothetical protein